VTVFTLGHSTRSIDAFLAMLHGHGVQSLLDVRTVPKSRHNPQFARDALASALRASGIAYDHVPALGGLRRARPDSANTGWRNTSFRGYADYMQTPEFAAAIDALVARARLQTVACMCAEAVPWRCHRSLIADALIVRGVDVADITGPASLRPHRLTPFASVTGTTVTYPAPVEGSPRSD
jgi:uncharacterized protein (DUF488 family)